MNKSGYMSGLEFLPVFLAIMMVIVSPLSAQPVITTTMSNSEFVGYVPDQIVVNFNSLTVLAIDKISAFQWRIFVHCARYSPGRGTLYIRMIQR